jgi:hypothetical protein
MKGFENGHLALPYRERNNRLLALKVPGVVPKLSLTPGQHRRKAPIT